MSFTEEVVPGHVRLEEKFGRHERLEKSQVPGQTVRLENPSGARFFIYVFSTWNLILGFRCQVTYVWKTGQVPGRPVRLANGCSLMYVGIGGSLTIKSVARQEIVFSLLLERQTTWREHFKLQFYEKILTTRRNWQISIKRLDYFYLLASKKQDVHFSIFFIMSRAVQVASPEPFQFSDMC